MEPLVIKDWQLGCGASQHLGFGLMRNVNIEEFPGAATANAKPDAQFVDSYSEDFTADDSTDICTSIATVPITGTAVTLTTTGTLPAGLSTGTNYFIIKLSSTTFKLATTIANAEAGTQIDITDTGTGTHTISTVDPGTVNHYVRDTRTDTIFCIDSNGRVWYLASKFRLLNGNTIDSTSFGKGLAILRTSDSTATYIFAFRSNAIDVVNVFGTTQLENPSWTNGWKTMNTSAGALNSHHAIKGQDGIIYFCDDRYIGSIRENTVFDPASGATYTYNNQALDLPVDEMAEWLEELGVNLLVAGLETNKIYPWDRVSDSFNSPLEVPKRKVYRMKNIGGVVYIVAGHFGEIFTTQGSYVKEFVRLPASLINNTRSLISNVVTWGGIGKKNGSLIIGLAQQTTGNSGVYRIFQDGRFVIDSIPSVGSTNVTAIIESGNEYLMGYNGGSDNISTDRRDSYDCVIQTGLYRVGTKTEKAKFSELEIQIAKSVIEGKIRVKYRTDTDSAFQSFTPEAEDTNLQNETSFSFDIGLIDIENLELQVEFQGDVELMEIRLYP